MHIAGCIFDLDGVLTDTAALHERAWREALAPIILTPEAYALHFDGRTRERGLLSFMASIDAEANSIWMGDVLARKDAIYHALLKTEGISVYGDAMTLMSLLSCPMGVASSSKNAKAVIRAAGLTQRFKVVIDGNGPAKPNSYRAAAEAMGVPFEECLVIEDSPESARMAMEAGAKYVVFARKDRA